MKRLFARIAPLQLGLIFFLVLTPVAVMLRLFKFDPLRLKKEPDLDTYWLPADENLRPDQMKQPF
jgi:hypothetical protein